MVDLDEDFGDLAQGQLLLDEQLLKIAEEEFLVELAEEKGELSLARVRCVPQEAVQRHLQGQTSL